MPCVMFSKDYSYTPLPPDNHARRVYAQKSSRLWRAAISTSFALNLVLLMIGAVVVFKPPPLQSYVALDHFQQLNNISAVAPLETSLLENAVVSAIYTDDYLPPILTLGHSLTSVNSTARRILTYIPGEISERTLCQARMIGWEPHPVPFIPPPKNKQTNKHYRHQYTKLNVWSLDQIGIKRVVYLDGDTLVRRNFDELFTLPFNFAAVPDVFDISGFMIGFNAGVMFLRTSTETFRDMLAKIETARYPRDFAEQAFLNLYFGPQANRLPYIYNGNVAIKRRSLELWEAIKDDMKIIHYTVPKPLLFGNIQREDEETFFESQKKIDGGLWKEEVEWWQSSYSGMQDVMGHGPQCG